MYKTNRKTRTCLYTDYMIYSPQVPVFRDDKGELLDSPYFVSFITTPAVNRGVVISREKHITQKQIDQVMKTRIRKTLALALEKGYEAIILGAFGCGVFRNNPKTVAKYFKVILNEEKFYNRFKKVTFSVLDYSEQKYTLKAFEDTFR